MMIKFSSKGWEDYLYWQVTDKVLLKRINMLIKEIEREPFTGKGKPEPLKHQLSSHAKVIWSFSPTLLRISNTRFFK